jgi:hypothetical protein
MVSFTATALSSLAAAGLVQFAPAPFAAIPVVVSINMGTAAAWAGAAGGIAGGAAGVASAIQNSKKRSVGSESWVNMRRQDDAQYGTQLAWELCRDDVQTATIGMERPQGNGKLSLSVHCSRPVLYPADCVNSARPFGHWYSFDLHDSCDHHHWRVQRGQPGPSG